MTEAAWQSRPEAGTVGGIRFLMWFAKHLGRRLLRVILWPVSGYFLLVRGPERRASRNYLNRVLERPATLWDLWRHIHRFSMVTADRFLFLAGRADDIPIRFVIDDKMLPLLRTGKTGIFLAAHFGSFEAARLTGPDHGDIELRIVLDKAINERFVALMQEVHPEQYQRIIDSSQGAVELGLQIKDALGQGAWVGFLADRFRSGDRTAEFQFLGDNAPFPLGPYLIASTFKAPIICAFCRLVDDGYEVHCEVLSESVSLPRATRDEALQTLVGAYVQRLEHHVRSCPFGWFNFYDFWEHTQSTSDS